MIDFAELERSGDIKPCSYGGFECLHQRQFPTAFTNTAQVVSVVLQCLTCGKHIKAIPKSQAPRLTDLDPFDANLSVEWESQNTRMRTWEREMRSACIDEAWHVRYREYLSSDDWKKTRAKVLQRSGYKCEACLESRATQVHHTSYENYNAGDPERCFELIAVCEPCHKRITIEDRERRGR